MNKKYYIQVGTDPYKSLGTAINDDYNIVVKETSGLNSTPPIKKPFSRSWADEQGLDVYVPDDVKFEEREITITFLAYGRDPNVVKQNVNTFLTYLFSANEFSYFDTYKGNGFRGYYDKSKMTQETYRSSQGVIEFSMTFTSPNGIGYGFYNLGNSSIFADVKTGSADFYFSDGTNVKNANYDIIKDLEDGFVIICPSSYRGVDIQARTPKVYLAQDTYSPFDEHLFVTENETLFIV